MPGLSTPNWTPPVLSRVVTRSHSRPVQRYGATVLVGRDARGERQAQQRDAGQVRAVDR